MNERCVKFRPTELQRIAGETIKQDYYPYITKLAEGGFNKVYLLRAKSGCEVIARIPTSIAGPPHYTTASKVATMDFLREGRRGQSTVSYGNGSASGSGSAGDVLAQLAVQGR